MIALYYATVKARPGIRSTRPAPPRGTMIRAGGLRCARELAYAGPRERERERTRVSAPKSAGDTRTTRSVRDYAVDRFEEATVLEARGKRLPRYAAGNGG